MHHTITSFLTEDHSRCDDLWTRTEDAVQAQRGARDAWNAFRTAIDRHFRMEEEALFPALERAVGGRFPPVGVMLMEHRQMRELFTQLDAAIAAGDVDEFSGLSQTLLIVMEQHNLKEQNILYPTADRALGATTATILEQMTALGS
jgi:hemerythrin-like domain-containing protein